MHVAFDVSDAVVAGAAFGAGTSTAVVMGISFVGAAAESMMSMGGTSGFTVKYLKGLAIYVPMGALVGGATAAIGLPALAAVPVMAATFGILGYTEKVRTRYRYWR